MTERLTFDYERRATSIGEYYTLVGENDTLVAGLRPVQPRTTRNVHVLDTVAHGALMLGGAFTEVTGFDPTISRVVTDELYVEDEFAYPPGAWYPPHVGVVNRFLALDGQAREQLVVVPGQFLATTAGTPTLGIERLYTTLEFEVYHAPITETDFMPPTIWQVEAISTSLFLRFRVLVEDDSGVVARTVVLYRQEGETRWSRAELTYNPASGYMEAFIPPVVSEVYYFAQAVDPAGNVALALDRENPFYGTQVGNLWDPSLPRSAAVEKMVSASTVAEGELVTFTVVVRNTGAGMLSGGVISDTLPAGLLLTGTRTLEPPGAGSAHLSPPYLAHDLEIAPGESVTLTFQAQALDGPAHITNTAAFTSAEITSPVLATAAITVTNVAPLALGDAYTVTGGLTLMVAAPGVLANDRDVPSDTLTAALLEGPSHGTLALALDGGFVYTPTAEFVGIDAFTYTVADEDGGAATAAVRLMVIGEERFSIYLPLVTRDYAGR